MVGMINGDGTITDHCQEAARYEPYYIAVSLLTALARATAAIHQLQEQSSTTGSEDWGHRTRY